MPTIRFSSALLSAPIVLLKSFTAASYFVYALSTSALILSRSEKSERCLFFASLAVVLSSEILVSLSIFFSSSLFLASLLLSLAHRSKIPLFSFSSSSAFLSADVVWDMMSFSAALYLSILSLAESSSLFASSTLPISPLMSPLNYAALFAVVSLKRSASFSAIPISLR